jgi:hypothetical protein
MEFHHALSLVRGHFDVACHAHRSYLSLYAVEQALAKHGLVVTDAEQIDLHGGSVRATATRRTRATARSASLQRLRKVELDLGLHTADGYRQVADVARRVKEGLLGFLSRSRSAGAAVVGYGAPSRGITLLNYCGIVPDLMPFTVDRSPAKQGHFLPGSHLPVHAPCAIESARPAYVLVLPWALAVEIVEQMSVVREWGGQFVVAVPNLRILA